MTDQLPAVLQPGALTGPSDRLYSAGDVAGWRYVEFFTANIRNPHTRWADARACGRFFAWCDDRGLTLTVIRSHDVAAWVEEPQEKHGAPGVKQQLATVRMLFEWLITGQVVPTKDNTTQDGDVRRENWRYRESISHFFMVQQTNVASGGVRKPFSANC